MDSVVCFVNTYPLDSDLSGGYCYPPLNNPDQVNLLASEMILPTEFDHLEESSTLKFYQPVKSI